MKAIDFTGILYCDTIESRVNIELPSSSALILAVELCDGGLTMILNGPAISALMEYMNWLDIVIAIILVIQVIVGLSQGLIKALLGLIGLIVGIVLAGRFYENLGSRLTFIDNPDAASEFRGS